MAYKSISPTFNSVLQEGNVYIISNFSVDRVDRGYRPVTNEYRIRFYANTRVTLVFVPVAQIPQHKFEFVPFDQIQMRYLANVQLCGTLIHFYFTFSFVYQHFLCWLSNMFYTIRCCREVYSNRTHHRCEKNRWVYYKPMHDYVTKLEVNTRPLLGSCRPSLGVGRQHDFDGGGLGYFGRRPFC